VAEACGPGPNRSGALLAPTAAVLASPAMPSVIPTRCGPLWVLLACGAGVMTRSGCLWKDDVNELPLVEIKGPASIHVGEKAEFTARVTNGKTGQMRFEWGKARGCPSDVASARLTGGERQFGSVVQWTIDPSDPPEDKASYCTFVIATDDREAEGLKIHEVSLIDRKLVLTVPAQVTSGMPVTYTARFSDDDTAADRSQFFWSSSWLGMLPDGPCLNAYQDALENQRSAKNVLPAQWANFATRTPYCVVAVARDNFGETFSAQRMITNIINGGPPATPRVVSPKEATIAFSKQPTVAIFSHVRLAAAEMGELGPSDELQFVWAVKRPDGTTMPAPACDGAMPPNSEVCFDVAGAGEYKVDLVTTEAGQTGRGSLNLKVEDGPPCIGLTDPQVPVHTGSTTVFSLDGEEKVLKVGQVVDDGDPLPSVGRASEGAFVWSIRVVNPETTTEAQFQLLPYAIFNSYTLPAGQYRLGDRVEVRVEYRDRLDVRDLKARDLSHCGPSDLSCATKPGGNCFLRVGWRVLYL
jgi:hypothetical protein